MTMTTSATFGYSLTEREIAQAELGLAPETIEAEGELTDPEFFAKHFGAKHPLANTNPCKCIDCGGNEPAHSSDCTFMSELFGAR